MKSMVELKRPTSSHWVLVLVHPFCTCGPMRDRVKQWLGLSGNDCFKHSAYGHMQARSRRWCLHAVWDVIRSLFVFMPSPRISLFANMLAWISITIPLSDHVPVCLSCFFLCSHAFIHASANVPLCDFDYSEMRSPLWSRRSSVLAPS